MGSGDVPERLRDLLPAVAVRFGLKDTAGTGVVWGRWAQIVGDHIAGHAEPTSLREGVLRVRADSPAWATEIGYLARDITRRINEAVGNELVRELRVWTGPGAVTRARRGQERADGDAGEEGGGSPDESVPEDPKVALQAARAAWERSRDPGSGERRKASERGRATGQKRR